VYLVSLIFYSLVVLLVVAFFASLFLLFTYSFFFILLVIAVSYFLYAVLKKGLFFIYPIIELFTRLFGLNVESLKRAVVDYSNYKMSRMFSGKVLSDASQILIVLPHCLQNSECLYKVTWDKLENCRLCGKCCVPKFLELKKAYGVDVTIVSGGTAAREIIKQKRPKAVIAVACENDLVSGLRDVKGIPVFAVLNQRPVGPCKDTVVDVEAVKVYILKLTGGRLK
jgi:uncharacterized protein